MGGSGQYIGGMCLNRPITHKMVLIQLNFSAIRQFLIAVWSNIPGFGEVVLAEGAGEALRAVAGEDAVVGLAGAAVVARGRVAQAARAHHRAHHRSVRGVHWNKSYH